MNNKKNGMDNQGNKTSDEDKEALKRFRLLELPLIET